jgi:inosose dehydratase
MSGFDPALFPPPDVVLTEMASAGYAGTELGDPGFLPAEQLPLRHLLDKSGLEMIGALVPIRLADPASHAPGREAAVRTARLLAECAGDQPPFVILTDSNGTDLTRTENAGRIRPEHGLFGDEWDTFARGTTEVARAIQEETGLRTVFHHHCAGFIETPAETERLLGMTPPDLVGLCFDSGHWAYAGGDPLDGLRKFRDRIWHVHFKDCHTDVAQQAREQGWDYYKALENKIYYGLGTGDVAFPSLLDELRAWDYDGWIVVEDELPPGAGDPSATAVQDREYLRGLGL